MNRCHWIAFFLLILSAAPLHALTQNDFNSDSVSDLTTISLSRTATLKWYYRDSASKRRVSLSAGGENGNHIAVAKWKGGTASVPGVLISGESGVTWRIFYNGATEEIVLGSSTDLLISGADFDASGSADACAVEVRAGKLIWKLRLDPFNGGSTTPSETEFGVDGDLPFFMNFDGSKDVLALVRRATDGTVTILVKDLLSSTESSFVLSRKFSTAIRPVPVRNAEGISLLAFPSRRSSQTRLLVFSTTGALVRKPILSGAGDIVVGDFIASSAGEEIAVRNASRFSVYNPSRPAKSILSFKTSIPVDEININSFGNFGSGGNGGSCTAKSATDGYKIGFVWKPNSDTQHYAVAVLPARYTNRATKVVATTTSGGSINSLRNKGCGNPDSQGPRCGWIATPYTGSMYRSQYGSIILKVTLSDGSCDSFLLSNPSTRID